MEKFNPKLSTVISRNGNHFVIMPNGDYIPCLISTVVVDTVSQHPVVNIMLRCNIADNEEDALNKYKESK